MGITNVINKNIKIKIFCLSCLIFTSFSNNQLEAGPLKDSFSAMEDGNFKAALELLKVSEMEYGSDYSILFNQAFSLYHLKKYPAALEKFQSVIDGMTTSYTNTSEAKQIEIKAITNFNIGNVYAHLQQWKMASGYYRKSLQLNNQDRVVRFNYAFALAQLNNSTRGGAANGNSNNPDKSPLQRKNESNDGINNGQNHTEDYSKPDEGENLSLNNRNNDGFSYLRPENRKHLKEVENESIQKRLEFRKAMQSKGAIYQPYPDY